MPCVSMASMFFFHPLSMFQPWTVREQEAGDWLIMSLLSNQTSGEREWVSCCEFTVAVNVKPAGLGFKDSSTYKVAFLLGGL